MSDPQWIVARVENQRAAIALRFLDLGGFTHYSPRARLYRRELYRGRMVNRALPSTLLFAPYLFVEMIDGQFGDIRRSIGIQSVVMHGDAVAIVPSQIIDGLKARESRDGLIDLTPRMRKGTRVQITQGSFAQYEGIIAADPSVRVKVLLDHILGARREVSFPHSAIAAV